MENYSLLMGAAVMKMAVEMAAVSMEKPSGHFPAPVPERDSVPGSWLRDGGGSEGERDEPHSYRYSPSLENYSLLMGAAAVMKMAVEMAAVSMEKPSGHFPLRQGAEQTPVPDLGFAMVAARKVSWVSSNASGFSRRRL
ncbi:hypothetical protein QYE76_045710 [Lolium multiflorum]|uniref:Uncharacterized protein n=1 Tax=Lolium multiflorum TaxID=4521 RepID=A0AAD8TNH4_LOLMU|nr:hypothetical protein QYE76_045710 [Lolium multiflorum]